MATRPAEILRGDGKVLTTAIARIAEFWGLTNAKLGSVLGLSPATVSRLRSSKADLDPASKSFEAGQYLLRLFRSLDALLGSDDMEAPSAETSKRIKSLIADGKDFTLALYPGAEHGMTEYEMNTKGERVSTRYVPGYFQMMADFIRNGRIGDHYGKAEITQPHAR